MPEDTGRRVDGPTLTDEQLEAWASFRSPAWQPFREAWLARGFRWPPKGCAGDDPDTSLRARLWEICGPETGGRPEDLGRWVREAAGTRPHTVIGEVFEAWAARRDVGALDDDIEEMAAYWRARANRGDAARAADREALSRLGVAIEGRPGPARVTRSLGTPGDDARDLPAAEAVP